MKVEVPIAAAWLKLYHAKTGKVPENYPSLNEMKKYIGENSEAYLKELLQVMKRRRKKIAHRKDLTAQQKMDYVNYGEVISNLGIVIAEDPNEK